MITKILLTLLTLFFSTPVHAHPKKNIKKTPPKKTPLKTVATVRRGNSFSQEEIHALYQRFPKVKHTLEHLLEKQLDNKAIPLIAIAGSGGGHRAMIASLGLLDGLHRLGALNSCMYLAGVSGTTWTMASWLAHNFSLPNLKVLLRDVVTSDFGFREFHWKQIIGVMRNKFHYDQKITFGDIWGGMVADIIFEGLPAYGQSVCMTDLKSAVQSGMYPIPLFTAVQDHTKPYIWHEFSPFECGSTSLQTWVPTWALGKKFKQGITDDPAPEQTLGFMVGMCSSAYAANVKEIAREVLSQVSSLFSSSRPSIPNPISMILNELSEMQISPPKIYNFARDLQNTPHADKKYLTLIDAGCDFNLPFPPLLRRNIDVYIVCDASSGANTGNKYHSLHGVVRYAKRNGYKLPPIDFSRIGKNTVEVFENEADPNCPIIVYFPNMVPFSTFKPQYTHYEFAQLYQTMRNTVIDARPKIIRAIEHAMLNLRKIDRSTLFMQARTAERDKRIKEIKSKKDKTSA